MWGRHIIEKKLSICITYTTINYIVQCVFSGYSNLTNLGARQSNHKHLWFMGLWIQVSQQLVNFQVLSHPLIGLLSCGDDG